MTSIAGNLDKSISMQDFLAKKAKVLKELQKGVASMRSYIYPSVLQNAGIPLIKKDQKKSVVIKYAEFSGIKLMVSLPVIDQQIRRAVSIDGDDDARIQYTLVLCGTNARCGEWIETLTQVTFFCKEVIEISGLQGDDESVKAELKQMVAESKMVLPGEDED